MFLIDRVVLMKKLDILYEDKDIIVVNKTAKILTINDGQNRPNLYAEVSSYVKKQNPRNKIYIVHRLDKDTSGIIVLAKSFKIKEQLQKNWDKVRREYVAIVEGILPQAKDTLVNFLKETKTYQVYVSNMGKKAITSYEVVKANKKYSLVNINIKTGRKNQIRVQLAYIGNPLVGDKKYGAKTNPLNRLALHAERIVLLHPRTKKELVITSDIPKEFLRLMNME